MADLVGQFLQGVEFGDAFYNNLIEKRQAQAKDQILLDGAQMQLEDDITTRPDRLNMVLAKLRDDANLYNTRRTSRTALYDKQLAHDAAKLDSGISTSLNTQSEQDQKRRFRGLLDGLQLETERNKLQADSSLARNNAYASDYNYDAAKATRDTRLATDVAQADTTRKLTETANNEATTGYNASNATMGVTQQGKIDAKIANANAARLGLTDTEYKIAEYGISQAKRKVNDEVALSDARSTEQVMDYYFNVSQDPQRSDSERIAARQLYEELASKQVSAQPMEVQRQQMSFILTSPVAAAIQAGLPLFRDPNDPNKLAVNDKGEYLMNDGYGNARPVSLPELQRETAAILNIDDGLFKSAAETAYKYRTQSNYGVSANPFAVFGAPGNGQ